MDPSNQRIVILGYEPESVNELVEASQTVFAIANPWWNSWCDYVGYYRDATGPCPGPISNESLFEGSSLKLSLSINDIMLISSASWNALKLWYQGGPEVELFIVDGQPDLTPIHILVWNSQDTKYAMITWKSLMVSSKITFKDLKDYLGKKFSIDPEVIELKLESSTSETRKLIGYDDCTLNDCMISDGTKIIVAKKDKKKVQLLDILEEEDDDLEKALKASLKEEEKVSYPKSGENFDIEMETIHIYSDPNNEADYRFRSSRSDGAAVAERIEKSMKEAKKPLAVHHLRRIQKNIMGIWEDYLAWQKQQ
ncbi:unnamed protein product [Blepharisma stoltei]|uniref:DUSP domain-containing protein n=1 Tax=Blepharisma stoltei TaxID=1481888 RepID=A0AAU9J1I4_9CILI|nr:unnamed protein product [Blepharisma stoltei]